MVETLLRTKLYAPPGRVTWVARPPLLARLNQGRSGRLTLVSAPAGFGKTSLVAAWLAEATADVPLFKVAWLALDEGDNDPTRFWTYVVAALQTVQAEVGAATLALLQATPPVPPAVLVGALINDLAERLPPTVLVLDDYHFLRAPAIHEGVTFLLEHQPPTLHLVITTRSDPPLPLTRLRGRGQLSELRADDLRFSVAEATGFLTHLMGLTLTEADAAALAARTEGWITGLQMAALSLRGRTDVAAFIAHFAGTHRYILDYLLEEVLNREPEPVQAFLLQTSILERLCGPLCDAILGAEGAEAAITLQELERANLFLFPLDDQRQWYRYHRLFADLLQARLAQACPERLPELHRRASDWYAQAGWLSEAVHHALAAGDPVRVARILEAHGEPLLRRGELTTLFTWLAALPEPLLAANARLCVYQAWAFLLTGQAAGCEPRLQQAERLLAAAPVPDLSGQSATIRAYVAAQQGDLPRAFEQARLALERLDIANLAIRAVVHFVLGGVSQLQGTDLNVTAAAMAEAARLGQAGGNVHVVIPALNALSGVAMLQGRLRQAETTARAALQQASDAAGRPLPLAASALSALAEIALERDELETALSYAQEALAQARLWGNAESLIANCVTLAQVLQAQGDLEGSAAALNEAGPLCSERTLTSVVAGQVQLQWAQWRLAQGDLPAAARWADTLSAETPGFYRLPELLLLARVRRAQGRLAEALKIVTDLLSQARAAGLGRLVIEALLEQALIQQAQREPERALAALTEVLLLAEPEGSLRRFVEAGPALVPLLRTALERGVASDFVRRLLAAPGAISAQPAGAGARPAVLVEPLSERELEVLALIAEGCANREIAQRLYVAESTVKSHVNAICHKLAAANRTQAVARARVLGVLK